MPLAVTAEWVQPSYYDALQMAKQRSGDWGFPVGVKAAADWQNCGTPTTAHTMTRTLSTSSIARPSEAELPGSIRVRLAYVLSVAKQMTHRRASTSPGTLEISRLSDAEQKTSKDIFTLYL